MKIEVNLLRVVLALLTGAPGTFAAVRYVDANNSHPTPPYTNWSGAATAIQVAVDAATAGDEIVVTNGVYAAGGRAVYGLMTNRVAVTKALLVRSVNGPEVTVIKGYQVPGTTNGPGAIRCVYLTNGAVLNGFTLTNGATHASGEPIFEQSGGGAWGLSSNALVMNCKLTGNSAAWFGGGAFSGALKNCTVTGDSASQSGGGAYQSTLEACALTGNYAFGSGGGAGGGVLKNCTLTGNAAFWRGGGSSSNTLINCILYYNRAAGEPNYSACTLNYCSTTPLPDGGAGNTDAEPQLANAFSLSAGSPCRGAGNPVYATGVDIDGEAWLNPPSIGCDEYQAGSSTGALAVTVGASWTYVAVGFAVDLTAQINGRASANAWDFGDGNGVSNRPYARYAWSAPGDYSVVFRAYNDTHPEGVSGSLLVRVIAQPVYYVSAASTNPAAPYSSWETAARTIQDAVDVSAAGGEVVVTDGVYASGGRAVSGLMTNRVAVTKALLVRSVNGPGVTVIRGYSTNRDAAIRCVYLAEGAVLSGFTLTNGATRVSGDYTREQGGGGVWCEPANAVVTNCTFTGNLAAHGGGACYGTLSDCMLAGNSASSSGGGVDGATLSNCSLIANLAVYGGGASAGTLLGCTLLGNSASSLGGGAYAGSLADCNVGTNSAPDGGGVHSCMVDRCKLTRNEALYDGGGSAYGTLNNCTLTGNSAGVSGGAASYGTLNNCALGGNSALLSGGGADGAALNNCTLTGNSAQYGGGVFSGTLENCVVYFNVAREGLNHDDIASFNYSCTIPLPDGGTGNISANPQLMTASHLSAGSPCRGAGNAAYATGVDIDGEAWLNPPSMGCDEYQAGGATGALGVAVRASFTKVAVSFAVNLAAQIEGPISSSDWDFGDGTTLTNQPYANHAWSEPGDYTVVLRAYNESNPQGVSATETIHVVAAVYYVSAASTNTDTPFSTNSTHYSTWPTAARTIQDAVDAVAVPGATVWVTNGVYATGGHVVDGTMFNRVAVAQPVIIRSVNGPGATIIQGARAPGTTNGVSAIRCVYLTNGAVLSGFTLTNGATRASGSYPSEQEQSGGGVWCASPSARVTNCTFTGNSAAWLGGGAYSGTLEGCTLTGNTAWNGGGAAFGSLSNCALTTNRAVFGGGVYADAVNNCLFTGNSAQYGGGSYLSAVNNSAFTGNSATFLGGGACAGSLNNCTITGNSAARGGGTCSNALNNCIVYYNTAPLGANYDSGVLNFCDAIPLPESGVGNLAAEPQLASSSRLSANSPCRGAGSSTYSTGVDIDGDAWLNPPSIGCDEYQAGGVTGTLSLAFRAAFTNVAVGFPVDFTASIDGTADASQWDFADGTTLANRPYASHAWGAAGDYRVVLRAYNGSYPQGISVTNTIHVLAAVYYVSAANTHPAPPYTNWSTAAQSIQTAVDAAKVPGALVLVTDGVYATGGRTVLGTMFNRVAVTNPVIVRSVNGPEVTLIKGQQAPGTINGPSAIRCVWLGDGAVLSGFTLTNGATRPVGYAPAESEQTGGGVWCESTNAHVINCRLMGNSAGYEGGGAFSGTLSGCTLTANWAGSDGGGAAFGKLENCALSDNSASWYGGAAYAGTLNNCTLTGNSAEYGGGGAYGTFNNCILYYNAAPTGSNYYLSSLNYCCTTPLPGGGVGSIIDEPQLASASHVSATSPCRGAGSSAFSTGVDIDGDPWLNPPSIGCDEYQPGGLTGPLSVGFEASATNVAMGFEVDFTAKIEGKVSASEWDFGDGPVLGNRPYISHAWGAAGDCPVVLRAYNETYPEGVSASLVIRVVAGVYYVSVTSATPVPPYTSWATAATNIQAAVDAAAVPGAMVMVTNGVYAVGGRAVFDLMTNRLAVTKPLLVRSVNGPEVTVIAGRQAPGTTNGAGAIRCVFLADGAVLSGFTLASGATRSSGDAVWEESGGGAWCETMDSMLTNCILTGNAAWNEGGGAYGGTLIDCKLVGNAAGSGGGGAFSGTLNNCILAGNSAPYGGGAGLATLNNSSIAANWAGVGGGVYSGTLNNCTVTGNSASHDGGGAYYGAFNNSIVYYNQAPNGPNHLESTINYSCTLPLPGTGIRNIADAPRFVDEAAGNLRLQSDSPCINGGLNLSAPAGPDLDGNPRIVGGTVDMGAYEFQTPASLISYAWLQQRGLPIDGSADGADPDGDGLNNLQEWRCGTNPTDASSVLRLLSPALGGTNVLVSWRSEAGTTYFLERATNCSTPMCFTGLATNLVGQADLTTYTDTNAPVGIRVYRVGVSLP